MLNRWGQLLFVVGAVAVAPACSGGDSSNAKSTAAQTKAVAAAGSSQEALHAELAVLLKRGEEGLVARQVPGGGVAIDLDQRYQSAAVVRRNPDGSLSSECFDEAASASQFMTDGESSQGGVQ